MHGVSIIICTYNRADLLKLCLDSFTDQTVSPANLEFIVVNNNSSDDTEAVVDSFSNKLPALKCVNENIVGLSHARNRGIHEAQYDWVCYMDDDAKAHRDYLERLYNLIENYRFDGFGGMFYPWYITPKPAWIPKEFGQMHLLRPDIGPLRNGKTVAGGICAFAKQKLVEAGYFPTDIGMRGKVVGYGEETILQQKMQANGAVIGFDPEWKIDHLVAEYKYSLWWHLKRSYAKGRDAQIVLGSLSLFKKLMLLIRGLGTALFLLLKNLFRWLTDRKYFYQNYLLDSLGFLFVLAGKASVTKKIARS
jgi:glucosyl-dolichyl phosphate glucuronosyltransferase